MKNKFDIEKIICCPNCKGDLIKLNSSNNFNNVKINVSNNINDTIYICDNCSTQYRKQNEIFILISKELEEELRK